MESKYQLGLLYLIHLLAGADGNFSESELNALNRVKAKENISDEIFEEFESNVRKLRERDIYQRGIECIKDCTRDEKLKAFATLYKVSEIDGCVHVKEIKLLLYSIERAGIEFDDVVKMAGTSDNLI